MCMWRRTLEPAYIRKKSGKCSYLHEAKARQAERKTCEKRKKSQNHFIIVVIIIISAFCFMAQLSCVPLFNTEYTEAYTKYLPHADVNVFQYLRKTFYLRSDIVLVNFSDFMLLIINNYQLINQ